MDESYFGGNQKIKRGRGAAGKATVFDFLKRGGNIYTQMIADAKSETLMPIIRRKIVPDSIVYYDCWKAYSSLDIQGFSHFRINHPKLVAEQKNYINGIENFWNQAKRHLHKFNDVPTNHFWLFLKECEWRFNYSKPKIQLSQLKQWVQDVLI